jgi:uncharacterized protein (UPF0332 family)
MSLPVATNLKRAEDSFAAAELLLSEGYPEYAASRAYYGMFYLAEAFLSTRGLAFSSHSAVVAAFGREFAKPELVPQHFHRYLIRAGELRLLADYRGTSIDSDEAQEQIDRGREMLVFARQHFVGQPPEAPTPPPAPG